MAYHFPYLALKNHQIADAIGHEHRSDEASTVLPELPICGEDAVTQKRRPYPVEVGAFPEGMEISGQDGFDM